MFLQKPGIYIIKNIVTNKVYIGSSTNISVRISSHKNSLKRNKHVNFHLQSSYNKYGIENFLYEIIEYCNEIWLLKKEEYYIKFFKSNDKNFGYNIEEFYKGRKRHSEESKLKISLGNKGKRKGFIPSQKAIDSFTAFVKLKKSDQHKENIRQAHLGKKRKPFSDEWKRKMSEKRRIYWNVFDLNNNLIFEKITTKNLSNLISCSEQTIHLAYKKGYILKKNYNIEQIGQQKLL